MNLNIVLAAISVSGAVWLAMPASAASTDCSGGVRSESLSCTGGNTAFADWAVVVWIPTVIEQTVATYGTLLAAAAGPNTDYERVHGYSRTGDNWGAVRNLDRQGRPVILPTGSWSNEVNLFVPEVGSQAFDREIVFEERNKSAGTYRWNGFSSTSLPPRHSSARLTETAAAEMTTRLSEVSLVVISGLEYVVGTLAYRYSGNDRSCENSICRQFYSFNGGETIQVVLGPSGREVVPVPGPVAGSGPVLVGLLVGWAAWRRRLRS